MYFPNVKKIVISKGNTTIGIENRLKTAKISSMKKVTLVLTKFTDAPCPVTMVFFTLTPTTQGVCVCVCVCVERGRGTNRRKTRKSCIKSKNGEKLPTNSMIKFFKNNLFARVKFREEKWPKIAKLNPRENR